MKKTSAFFLGASLLVLLLCMAFSACGKCKEHTYGDWTTSKEATCTQEGEETRTCEKCAEVEKRVVAAKGHTITAVAEVPKTCTADGVKAHDHCSVCNKDFVDGVEKTAADLKIPAAHTTTAVAEVPRTCTADGVKAHDHCNACGKDFIDGAEKSAADLKIAAGHTTMAVAEVPKTCTADGVKAHDHCNACGKDFIDGVEKTAADLKIAAGHTTAVVAEVLATCTVDGVKAHDHCSACGKDFIDGVEKSAADLKIAAGHTTTAVAEVPKTCTADGVKAHDHCSACGKDFIGGVEKSAADLKIPAAHTTTAVAEVPKTCTADGVKAHDHCDVCGKDLIDGVEKIAADLKIAAGHELTTVPEQAADRCAADGKKAHDHCKLCQKDFVDGVEKSAEELRIPAAAHSLQWVERTPNSCTEDGELAHNHCTVCQKDFDEEGNELSTIVIPAAHTPGEWTDEVPATCETSGTLGYYTCTECGRWLDRDGNVLEDIYLPAGHHFTYRSNDREEHTATCDRCSYEEKQSHTLWKNRYQSDGEYFYRDECLLCDYDGFSYHYDPIVSVTVLKDFIRNWNSSYDYRLLVKRASGRVEKESLEDLLKDKEAYQRFVYETLPEMELPATQTFVVGDEFFSTEIEIRFIAISSDVLKLGQSVYQQGYFDSLTQLRIRQINNAYESSFNLTEEMIVDDGGFSPNLDLGESGKRTFTIRISYEGTEYEFTFDYVSKRTPYSFRFYEACVTGRLPGGMLYYTDGQVENVENILEYLTPTGTAYDPQKAGYQRVTYQLAGGYDEQTAEIFVQDEHGVQYINCSWDIEMGTVPLAYVSYFGNYPDERLPLTDLITGGNPAFSLSVPGVYELELSYDGYYQIITVTVYDPNDESVDSIRIAGGDNDLFWESENGEPKVDVTGLYLWVTLKNRKEKIVPVTADMISFDADAARSCIANGNILEVTVTYEGCTTILRVSFEASAAQEIELVQYSESYMLLFKDRQIPSYLFVKIRMDNGYCRYLPLTADLLYTVDETGNKTAFSLADAPFGRYDLYVVFDELQTNRSYEIFVYDDSMVEHGIYAAGDDPCTKVGTKESVLERLANLKIYYSTYIQFGQSSFTLPSENILFADLTLGDLSGIDFSKPGRVEIPVSYNGTQGTISVLLIPDMTDVPSTDYTYTDDEANSMIFKAYENGFLLINGEYYLYRWENRELGILSIEVDANQWVLFLVNQEAATISDFTASSLGGTPLICYLVDIYAIRCYTLNGVSFLDIYQYDASAVDCCGDYYYTMPGVLSENNTALSFKFGTYQIGADGELSPKVEGAELYAANLTMSGEKTVFSFHDNGFVYIYLVLLDAEGNAIKDENGKVVRGECVYIFWYTEKEDILTVYYEGIVFVTLRINADGSLSLQRG